MKYKKYFDRSLNKYYFPIQSEWIDGVKIVQFINNFTHEILISPLNNVQRLEFHSVSCLTCDNYRIIAKLSWGGNVNQEIEIIGTNANKSPLYIRLKEVISKGKKRKRKRIPYHGEYIRWYQASSLSTAYK